MKSPIIFNFDRNIIFIILHYISLYFNSFMDFPIFIKELILFISMIISLICFYQRNKFSHIDKKIKKKINFTNQLAKINYDKNKGTPTKKDYLVIIFFYFLLNIIPFFNNIRFIRTFIIYSWCSNSIFIGILIGYFRQNKFYRHQLLSAIILFFLMFLYPNFYMNLKKHHFFFNFLFSILFYYLQGLFRIYFKFAMEIKFINPFFISAIDVGMNIFKNFLVYGYYYFLVEENRKKSYFNSNWNEKMKKMTLIPCILSIIGNISFPIFNIITCYIYSPYHQSICDNFGYFFELLIKEFISKNVLIGIINLFFSLVASEIIILKFCNLDKDTKIEIQNRAIQDQINNTILNDSNMEQIMDEKNDCQK